MTEKDRFGDTLREKEKAEEDRYFAQRDRELIAKLRQAKTREEESTIRELSHMRCPRCGERLTELIYHGVTVERCSACHGIWLDRGELEIIAQRENEGWFARFFRRS